MSTTWTLEQMHEELKRARHLARKWVRLKSVRSVISPHYVFADDELTIPLNPVIVGYTYEAKSACPGWLKRDIQGRGYEARGETDSIHGEHFQQAQAYGVIEAAIIRKRGYNGYIQGELPF
jgi:hypothetical protein